VFERLAKNGPVSILIMTNIGILLGVTVMLVIGIFELHIVVKTS